MGESKPQFAATPWTVDGMVIRDRYGRQVGGAEPTAPPARPTDAGPATSDEMDAQGRVHALAMGAAPQMLDALQTLIDRVRHYAPAMERNGDLDEARAAIKAATGGET